MKSNLLELQGLSSELFHTRKEERMSEWIYKVCVEKIWWIYKVCVEKVWSYFFECFGIGSVLKYRCIAV